MPLLRKRRNDLSISIMDPELKKQSLLSLAPKLVNKLTEKFLTIFNYET